VTAQAFELPVAIGPAVLGWRERAHGFSHRVQHRADDGLGLAAGDGLGPHAQQAGMFGRQ